VPVVDIEDDDVPDRTFEDSPRVDTEFFGPQPPPQTNSEEEPVRAEEVVGDAAAVQVELEATLQRVNFLSFATFLFFIFVYFPNCFCF
jgi:hypothetical protein